MNKDKEVAAPVVPKQAKDVPECLKREVQEKKVSKVATTKVLEADKDNLKCSKTKVQEVGKTDVSKVADVFEADKVRKTMTSSSSSSDEFDSDFSSFVEDIVSSKWYEDMIDEDGEEFWIKNPKDGKSFQLNSPSNFKKQGKIF
nr:hypothetical protein [Tanacetum cinerariifolium]